MSDEIDSIPPTTRKPPLVRLVKDQEVSLGCGSLIVIALIVLFCSGGGVANLSHELGQIRSELADLKRLVQQQNTDIQSLRDHISRKP